MFRRFSPVLHVSFLREFPVLDSDPESAANFSRAFEFLSQWVKKACKKVCTNKLRSLFLAAGDFLTIRIRAMREGIIQIKFPFFAVRTMSAVMFSSEVLRF